METSRDGKSGLSAMAIFRTEVTVQFWEYQQTHFEPWQTFLDMPKSENIRPPVFLPDTADSNLLTKPGVSEKERKQLYSMVPISERHKWFRSMSSSQALAQSILGNLAQHGCLDVLSKLTDPYFNDPIFAGTSLATDNFVMEFDVDYLGERRRTSLDGFFQGDYRIAIECKFQESEVGSCSRPNLKDSAWDHCDGSYAVQKARKERCPLSEIHVRYWLYVPFFFKWVKNVDYSPCPLWKNYQLVRNVLAAGVKPDGSVSPQNGHAVLIYDARNPSFAPGGKGHTAFEETRAALRYPEMLRKCTWQQITALMRQQKVLPWLIEQLDEKYGL